MKTIWNCGHIASSYGRTDPNELPAFPAGTTDRERNDYRSWASNATAGDGGIARDRNGYDFRGLDSFGNDRYGN